MRLTELIAAAVDLVLPTDCVGCGAPSTSSGVCGDCIAAWRIVPREVRPVPAPEGLPPCLSATEYGGLSRSLVLAYKDGRRGLAAMLGDALAQTVAAGAGRPTLAWPLVLIPVPATAAAIRARHGDHMLRLARRAAVRLRRDGWPVRIMRPLRARRKVDAGHLDRHERARAAREAFVFRASRAVPARTAAADAVVVVLDDVLTTGATVAAVCRRLQAAGAPVAFAATVAATSLRSHGQRQ